MKLASLATKNDINRKVMTARVLDIDFDQITVLPRGSSSAVRRVKVSGDISSLNVGDEVSVVVSNGQRVALASNQVDLPTQESPVNVTPPTPVTTEFESLDKKYQPANIVFPPPMLTTFFWLSACWTGVKEQVPGAGARIKNPFGASNMIANGSIGDALVSGPNEHYVATFGGGVNDYMYMPNAQNYLVSNTHFCCGIWFRPNVVGVNHGLFDIGSTTYHSRLYLGSNNVINFQVYSTADHYAPSVAISPVSTGWHFACGRYIWYSASSRILEVFVDGRWGANYGSDPGLARSPAGDIRVGATSTLRLSAGSYLGAGFISAGVTRKQVEQFYWATKDVYGV